MLKRILIISGLLLLTSLPALAVTIAYSKTIEDLPMMIGMTEQSEDAVIFDKPGGRIVETSAEVYSSAADVKRFYTETLPALGWTALPELSFSREGETLKINIEKKDDIINIVHFNLTPDDAGK